MHRIIALSFALAALQAQSFEDRVRAIMNRPEYRHARFGMEFFSIEEGRVLYSYNAQELFVPGSTTKILSVGTALELLGPDFRFHTRVYRTAPLKDGSIDGDLILVASGDPDLSNRIQPDGTMVFENEDHSYDGFAEAKAVRGDPLAVIRELASKVAAAGVRRVTGTVRVNASLFPEGARQPFFADFKKSLPVLGKDGTLYNIQPNSPAARHVFAKTGTLGGGLISGKGLAGFIDTKDGAHLAFAAYINFVPVAAMNESATAMAGDALGEIAAAAYDGFSHPN